MNPVSSTYFLFDGISLAVLNSLMPQGFLELSRRKFIETLNRISEAAGRVSNI